MIIYPRATNENIRNFRKWPFLVHKATHSYFTLTFEEIDGILEVIHVNIMNNSRFLAHISEVTFKLQNLTILLFLLVGPAATAQHKVV